MIIERNNKRKTYDILDKSNIIINAGSTAGYEALSRLNKVGLILEEAEYLKTLLILVGLIPLKVMEYFGQMKIIIKS